MKESEQDISMIEDEDFILLLGSTGAGKSTTLQYLSGLKMVSKETKTQNGEKLPHIESAEEIKD